MSRQRYYEGNAENRCYKINSTHLSVMGKTQLDTTAVIERLQNSPDITSISIGNNFITFNQLNKIFNTLENNKSVTKLSLNSMKIKFPDDLINEGHNPENTYKEIVKSLTELLKDNKVISILDLSNCKITSVGIEVLAKMLEVNTSLSTLYLKNCELNVSNIKIIARALKPNQHLEKLSLAGNDLTAPSVQALTELLIKNKTITSLNLNGCNITNLGAKHLSSKLSGDVSLKTLHLNFNKIGDTGLYAIANMLCNNKSLASFYLIGLDKCVNKGFKFIAKFLEYNNTLSELCLSHNNIDTTAAETIASSLIKNSTLSILDLSHNNITIDGVLSLLSALAETNREKPFTLNISHNNITDAEYEMISKFLQGNTSISVIITEESETTKYVEKLFKKAKDDLDDPLPEQNDKASIRHETDTKEIPITSWKELEEDCLKNNGVNTNSTNKITTCLSSPEIQYNSTQHLPIASNDSDDEYCGETNIIGGLPPIDLSFID